MKGVRFTPKNYSDEVEAKIQHYKKEGYKLPMRSALRTESSDGYPRKRQNHHHFAGFTDTFLGIGDRLASLQRDYDKAFNQLSDGNGSVVRQAEMLKGMSLTPKKRISPRLLPKDTIQEETEEENDNIQ